MNRRTLLTTAPFAVLALGVFEAIFASLGRDTATTAAKEGNPMPASTAVYELRIYQAVPGKLDELIARFRDHTMALFAKHGMKSLAYWTALDEPAKSNNFFYILEHPSREAAAANWKAFEADPEWQRVKAKTEENGKLVVKVDSTYLALTNFSPKLS